MVNDDEVMAFLGDAFFNVKRQVLLSPAGPSISGFSMFLLLQLVLQLHIILIVQLLRKQFQLLPSCRCRFETTFATSAKSCSQASASLTSSSSMMPYSYMSAYRSSSRPLFGTAK